MNFQEQVVRLGPGVCLGPGQLGVRRQGVQLQHQALQELQGEEDLQAGVRRGEHIRRRSAGGQVGLGSGLLRLGDPGTGQEDRDPAQERLLVRDRRALLHRHRGKLLRPQVRSGKGRRGGGQPR